jgi:hypothetical protein
VPEAELLAGPPELLVLGPLLVKVQAVVPEEYCRNVPVQRLKHLTIQSATLAGDTRLTDQRENNHETARSSGRPFHFAQKQTPARSGRRTEVAPLAARLERVCGMAAWPFYSHRPSC